MGAKELLLRIRRQRQVSVDLGDGLKVTFLRPPESEQNSFIVPTSGDATKFRFAATIEHAKTYVVDWEGFTEATFLGASVGSSDVLAFDSELWAEALVDRIEWVGKVAQAILDSVIKHIDEKSEAAKNSQPAST